MRDNRGFKVIGFKKEGSLSIEAAAIVPMYLVGLLTLASLLLMYEFRMKMQASLLFAAESLAAAGDGLSVSVTDVSEMVYDSFGLSESSFRYVENGREGVDFSSSRLDNPEFVELTAEYNMVPFSDFFGLLKVSVSDSAVVHSWCGYNGGYLAEDDTEYVYVTDDSEVFHRDRDCSHIHLSIIETTGNEVGKLRNDDGSKYRACELCKARKKDGVLFVTTDGDRFHNTITCSGLKRTVRSMKEEEAVRRGLRPCSRCGM